MAEFPIFMSYRRVDGESIALLLRSELHGRVITLDSPSGLAPYCISLYFDQAQAASKEWKKVIAEELENARALIVVCTQCSLVEAIDDWYYYELRWWLENRRSIPPILVTPRDESLIPKLLRDQWPGIQWVRIDPDRPNKTAIIEHGIQSVLSGILSMHDGSGISHDLSTMNIAGLYQWEKDQGSRYIWCNDNYARVAGFDSPAAMIGKTDDAMAWRSLAEFFRAGDRGVIAGIGPPRFHVHEIEIMAEKVAEILVTEQQLLDHRNECIGVQGYFIDTTGHVLPKIQPFDSSRGHLQLGGEFGDERLSIDEVAVLKQILLARNGDEIVKALSKSRAEIDAHCESIKRKLQCTNTSDIIKCAIRSALTLKLFSIDTTPCV